jgi:outer membrane protein OmpA-like peptidoglycan-associated protein
VALLVASAGFGAGTVARGDEPPPAASSPETPRPPVRSRLEVTIDRSKIDLEGHRLELKASRDLAKVTLKVTGQSGNVLASEVYEYSGHAAGTPLVVGWSPINDEQVAQIEVWAYDTDGNYKWHTFTWWSVSIPHEEVNFKTGSSQIEDTERAKLEASYARVSEALAKHPELRVTLFIAGHTDTVASASYNLALSRRRAKAIASWFRTRGLTIPIAYEGFGESALLVKTADEVDEPRNRRADYILAIDEPAFKASGYRPTWTRLP